MYIYLGVDEFILFFKASYSAKELERQGIESILSPQAVAATFAFLLLWCRWSNHLGPDAI